MEFLSGGYYKATIHRVVQPPDDQRGYQRVGLFYLTMPDDDVLLAPDRKSPVLQKQSVKFHVVFHNVQRQLSMYDR